MNVQKIWFQWDAKLRIYVLRIKTTTQSYHVMLPKLEAPRYQS